MADKSTENSRRERGTGSIWRKGRYYWLQYYAHGQKIRISAGTDDPRKAEKLLKLKVAEVRVGVHRDVRRLTYEDLREAYIADYRTNGRKSLRFDREGNPSLDKVTRLDGFFTGWRSADIDSDVIRKFTAAQQANGLSNASINRSISALRRMFNLAKVDGKLRDVPHFPMLKEARARQGFFEPEQYDELARALPEYLRLPLSIGYFTGMRLGEILSLEWNQVDFLDGIIRLRAGETKNDEAREVPIAPQLHTLLERQFALRHAGCEFVCFRLQRTGEAGKISSFRKAWYSACIKAGLGKMEPAEDRVTGRALFAPPRGPRSKPKMKMVYQGMIFHDLRRTGVRNLVRAGVPERVAQEISGHKTRSVFARYNIVSPSDVREAGRKLGIFHAEKFGPKTDTFEAEPQRSKAVTQ